MSTVNETPAPAAFDVSVLTPKAPLTPEQSVAMTLEQQLKHFGDPPAGKRYIRSNGKLIIGQDGFPATGARKAKGSRNKPRKPKYGVPSTKLRTHETPGFDINSMARLRDVDFADPLDFLKWDVWYYEQKVEQAKKAVANLSALGSTPEERNKAKEVNRAMEALERLIAAQVASGNPALAGAMQERLGKLFSDVQT